MIFTVVDLSPCVYTKRHGENGTVKYVDVMSLYLYICKYFKFPVGHSIIQVGDACKDIDACLRMDGLINCLIDPQKSCITPSSFSIVIINSYFACVERAFSPPQMRNVCIPEIRIVP